MSKSSALCKPTRNFLVIGPKGGGLRWFAKTLNQCPLIKCRLGLLDLREEVRFNRHKFYYKETNFGRFPLWLDNRELSVDRYLTEFIFDHPVGNEKYIGCVLNYDEFEYWQLYDLLTYLYYKGDFCVIHLKRSPLAALVSHRQSCEAKRHLGERASSITLNIEDTINYLIKHQTNSNKVSGSIEDILELPWYERIYHRRKTLRLLCTFLELSNKCIKNWYGERWFAPRLKDRIFNWYEILNCVPKDLLMIDEP